MLKVNVSNPKMSSKINSKKLDLLTRFQINNIDLIEDQHEDECDVETIETVQNKDVVENRKYDVEKKEDLGVFQNLTNIRSIGRRGEGNYPLIRMILGLKDLLKQLLELDTEGEMFSTTQKNG